MAYIKTLSKTEAPARLRKLHKEIEETLGIPEVPNIFKCASLDYDISKWIWQGFKTVLARNSSIPRPLKDQIAVVVSKNNSCQYCVDAHNLALQAMGFDSEKTDELNRDYRTSSLSEEEKAALDFAIKISNNAYRVTEKDHQELREKHGYSDQQILEIVTVASVFDFVNRFVLAL